ncbi:hypothetical protein [Rhizobium sullae]|uniref:Uncharacterized protein n=1 Tax=Rhizobium sullae TaxID=50338 RepID=A0A4V2V7X6_RHISU|nr:hypothetical protein [Rhizobium sullae]TCU06819.1 hypothetical protein EV132_13130 [Rhizobium sullae]
MQAHLGVKESTECVILIPVGPRSQIHQLNDTLESIKYFSCGNTVIVLLDDTRDSLRRQDLVPDLPIDLLPAEKSDRYSVRGNLYINLSKAIKYIINKYDFTTLLRMDDDALFIGGGSERAASQYFDENSAIGCLGSFRYSCTGKRRDFAPAARRLAFEKSLAGTILDSALAKKLREIHKIAAANGYEPGEHCLGAACFYSKAAIMALAEQDLLEREELRATKLCDDQLFGMLLVAAGFHAADFAGPGQPLGLAWQGLPAAPEALVALDKKIVHSVKSYKDASQDDIRREFAGFRTQPSVLADLSMN